MKNLKFILLSCVCLATSCVEQQEPYPANNEIWYTSVNAEPVNMYLDPDFPNTIISNRYVDGKGVIRFEQELMEIPSGAFAGCDNLNEVSLPNSVTRIGEWAFDDCETLTDVTMPNSVTHIGRNAFSDCASLMEIIIPKGVTHIGRNAFDDCTSLSEIIIPQGVTHIGIRCFAGCKNLTSVTIPNNVIEFGAGVFVECTGLREFRGGYVSEDGKLLIVDNVVIAGANTNTLTIPNGAVEIKEQAFLGLDKLTQVFIPNSVSIIGRYAFAFATKLRKVTIPEQVIAIERGVFRGCELITNIEIPEGVTAIGGFAFAGCESLTSITFPRNVNFIGDGAFYDCKNLVRTCFESDVPPHLGKFVFAGISNDNNFIVPNPMIYAQTKTAGWGFYRGYILCGDTDFNQYPDDIFGDGVYSLIIHECI